MNQSTQTLVSIVDQIIRPPSARTVDPRPSSHSHGRQGEGRISIFSRVTFLILISIMLLIEQGPRAHHRHSAAHSGYQAGSRYDHSLYSAEISLLRPGPGCSELSVQDCRITVAQLSTVGQLSDNCRTTVGLLAVGLSGCRERQTESVGPKASFTVGCCRTTTHECLCILSDTLLHCRTSLSGHCRTGLSVLSDYCNCIRTARPYKLLYESPCGNLYTVLSLGKLLTHNSNIIQNG